MNKKLTPEERIESDKNAFQYRTEYRAKHKDKIKDYLDAFRKDRDNSEKHKEYMKLYNQDEERYEKKRLRVVAWQKANPNKFQFNQVKSRAKANNIEFNLEFDKLVWPDVCPVLGIKLHRESRDNHPSFDRVIPNLGYTQGNVCIISYKANRLKQESTLDQLEKLIEYIKSNSMQHANIDLSSP